MHRLLELLIGRCALRPGQARLLFVLREEEDSEMLAVGALALVELAN